MTVVEELLNKCQQLKKCCACGENKQLFEFSKNKAAKYGLQYRCKPCDIAYQTAYRSKNKEHVLERDKKHKTKLRNKKCILKIRLCLKNIYYLFYFY